MPILLRVEWVELLPDGITGQRVKSVGGRWGASKWQHTQENAILYIEQKSFAYYIQNGGLPMSIVVVANADGMKYLATREDTKLVQYLLAMPGSPAGAHKVK